MNVIGEEITHRLGERLARRRPPSPPSSPTAPRSTSSGATRAPLVPAQRGPEGTGSVVRARRPGDLPSVGRLLRGIAGSDYPLPRPDSLGDWLVDAVLAAWVVERHGLVLGHVALADLPGDSRAALRWRELTGLSGPSLVEVSRFFVRVPDRDKGLGTALLATAAAEAHARGRVPVAEAVSADRWGAPIFERTGWRQVGRYPRRRGDDRITYLYLLPPGR